MATSFPPDNVANVHETATVAGYVYALGQQFSPPYQFHDHVGSRTVGKLPQQADAGLGGIEFLDIDSVVGAELLSQLQAVHRTVQDNDPVGPHVLGHGGGVRAKASGPLDDNVLPLVGAGPYQAGGYGAHGAVDGPQQVAGQFVGAPEEGMTGRQVREIGVGTSEAGIKPCGGISPVGAPLGIAPQARVAAMAREDGLIDYPVALLDGCTQGIGGDAFAHHLPHPVSSCPMTRPEGGMGMSSWVWSSRLVCRSEPQTPPGSFETGLPPVLSRGRHTPKFQKACRIP